MIHIGGNNCIVHIEFGVNMKQDRLIEVCLNETCSKFRIEKHLHDNFATQIGPKAGDILSPLLFNFALGYTIRKVQESKG
jgi:hypothetical protein